MKHPDSPSVKCVCEDVGLAPAHTNGPAPVAPSASGPNFPLHLPFAIIAHRSTDVILEPSSSAMTFQDLHIKPTPLEKVAFNYLYR